MYHKIESSRRSTYTSRKYWSFLYPLLLDSGTYGFGKETGRVSSIVQRGSCVYQTDRVGEVGRVYSGPVL